MVIGLELDGGGRVRASVIEDKNSYFWDDVRGFFPDRQELGADSFAIPYYDLLAKWNDLFRHSAGLGIVFRPSHELVEVVQEFQRNHSVTERNFSAEELKTKLRDAGFVRELKEFQVENVCKLVRCNQGATFSVPGAGKTTEALAFFFATALPTDQLLVISPINAFGAWDEQIVDCTGNGALSFVRLAGGAVNVKRLLQENHRFMIINYEGFRSVGINEPVRDYLRTHANVYVFLDESHKIKNGKSAQAEAIRLIQGYPKAKLIMSGTPMPQCSRDLIPQYNFLFPDKSVTETDVVEKFQNVYVRTTADRLGITDIKWRRKDIPLDDVEKELYKRMRSIVIGETGDAASTNEARYLRNLGKSVMRLMAFVSNPALIADHFAPIMPHLPEYLRHNDSKKIAYVCNRARELAKRGKKVLIWSSFVRNVELIAYRLQDVGADYIHGGVAAGDVNDPLTREGKIRRFHDSDGRMMVLVANPAAASEGISLHKVCQYAIYLDRSFNAAHFLQSQDRIHRLGLPKGTVPEIELVMCPGTIDEVVDVRLHGKISAMANALNDPSIIPSDPELLYDDDHEDGQSVDETASGISRADIDAILAHLRSC